MKVSYKKGVFLFTILYSRKFWWGFWFSELKTYQYYFILLYAEALAITKFKIRQCILMTDSPNLMLAKVIYMAYSLRDGALFFVIAIDDFLFVYSANLDKELKYDRQKLEANRGLTQQHHQLLQQKVMYEEGGMGSELSVMMILLSVQNIQFGDAP